MNQAFEHYFYIDVFKPGLNLKPQWTWRELLGTTTQEEATSRQWYSSPALHVRKEVWTAPETVALRDPSSQPRNQAFLMSL